MKRVGVLIAEVLMGWHVGVLMCNVLVLHAMWCVNVLMC
jgi:hypothetical protein